MSYIYESIVLTSIDVEDSPTPDSPNRVVFSASTPGSRDDTTATFIHKVKDVANDDGSPPSGLLEAVKLLPGEVQKVIDGESSDEIERSTSKKDEDVHRKILFSVHGFAGDPRGYLLQIKWVEERFQKFKLIPVLWPSAGMMVGYFRDRALSKAAGKAFQSIAAPTEGFSKSILCHSMGNRVLRNFANSEHKFENIFMVAPDVDGKMFNQSYIEGGKQEWRKDGMRIKDMLAPNKGGKIHILYNKNDSDLLLSTIINMKSRLGREGVSVDGCCCSGDKLHDDVESSINTVDWTNSSPSSSHNYQFDWGAVAYYESHYV
mmetsp:Transcript_19485/g.24535  ORF Transcript_19485/g.24535 Transcript_19485/m.24535 type:complete len:318 (-) Transcript_19485:173-1126(-)